MCDATVNINIHTSQVMHNLELCHNLDQSTLNLLLLIHGTHSPLGAGYHYTGRYHPGVFGMGNNFVRLL
jgi:hypothetical protein